jgi:hypothetical protein
MRARLRHQDIKGKFTSLVLQGQALDGMATTGSRGFAHGAEASASAWRAVHWQAQAGMRTQAVAAPPCTPALQQRHARVAAGGASTHTAALPVKDLRSELEVVELNERQQLERSQQQRREELRRRDEERVRANALADSESPSRASTVLKPVSSPTVGALAEAAAHPDSGSPQRKQQRDGEAPFSSDVLTAAARTGMSPSAVVSLRVRPDLLPLLGAPKPKPRVPEPPRTVAACVAHLRMMDGYWERVMQDVRDEAEARRRAERAMWDAAYAVVDKHQHGKCRCSNCRGK